MTSTCTVHTRLSDRRQVGEGRSILEAMAAQPRDALVVFGSSKYRHEDLLAGIQDTCAPRVMVRSSSAGEFTEHSLDEGAASAIAFDPLV